MRNLSAVGSQVHLEVSSFLISSCIASEAIAICIGKCHRKIALSEHNQTHNHKDDLTVTVITNLKITIVTRLHV